jgi:hypothetical protein
MKYVDMIGQTILIVLTFALIIPYSWLAFMIGPVLLGAWQMVSSCICAFTKVPYRNLKRIHLGIATTYLILLAYELGYEFTFLAIAIPLTLAIYYYILTWMWFLSDPKKGKFLPNISF